MRVGLFHFYSLTYGGGGERFITELATYLSSRGYAVEVHASLGARGGSHRTPFGRPVLREARSPCSSRCRLLHVHPADAASVLLLSPEGRRIARARCRRGTPECH